MRFLVLFLVAFPGWAWAACVAQPRATVPLHVIEGALLVSVMVNGIEGTFILDTGASRSVVPREATRRLELARDPWVGTAMRGVGGVEKLPNANPRTLTLGGIPLVRRTLSHDTSLTVGTLPHTQAGGRTIDGLLGRDFLSAFDMVLDMPAGTVTLWAVNGCSGRFLPWPAPYTAIAAENPMDSALVLPVVLDGVRLRALLDTGAGSTLVAAPGMARLGLSVAALERDQRQDVSGLGPRTVVMHRHRFTRLRIGPETMDGPMFWAAPVQLNPIVDMLLGADWLAGKTVWISFATKQVFVAGR